MNDRSKAILLRHKGFSIREIAKHLSVSKGSVSIWVRGIGLKDEHPARLKKNQDIGRAKAANHPNSPIHRPLLAVSRAGKGIRKTLPLGTFRIVISDVYLRSRIQGWLEGVSFWANSSVG